MVFASVLIILFLSLVAQCIILLEEDAALRHLSNEWSQPSTCSG